ncbi:MAG: PorT family protein [Candidatus Latescibacterota bacterium]|nr:MAG: PorT family protein [Candidatus Latescibacterota bacterium]
MNRTQHVSGACLATTLFFLGAFPASAGGFTFALLGSAGLGRSHYEISSIDEDEIESGSRPAFAGGLRIGWSPTGQARFSLESGLLLRMKGGQSERVGGVDEQGATFVDEPFRLTWKQLYLSIPILARASFPRESATPYVEIGPEFGIPLSGTMETENAPSDPVGGLPTSETDITEILVFPEVSITVGAGLDFTAGGHRLFAGLEYSHGLTDVLDTVAVLENRTLSAVVGWRP